MKEKVQKIKQNKPLKVIGEILYILLFLIVILMLIVVILQRVTDNSVTIGGFRIFTVATGSMVPKYEVGDILISKEIDPSEIKVGDDIVYKGKEGSFNGKVVTHRVISIEEQGGEYHIITQGIANEQADPEITDEQVYGKIIYKVKTLSFISKMVSNIYIFYFFIFIPIAILIVKQIRQIATSNEEDDDDDEEQETKDVEEKAEEKIKRNSVKYGKIV